MRTKDWDVRFEMQKGLGIGEPAAIRNERVGRIARDPGRYCLLVGYVVLSHRCILVIYTMPHPACSNGRDFYATFIINNQASRARKLTLHGRSGRAENYQTDMETDCFVACNSLMLIYTEKCYG